MTNPPSQRLTEVVSTHLTPEQYRRLEAEAIARSEPGNRIAVSQLLRMWLLDNLDDVDVDSAEDKRV